jgi:hypothetical protein
MLVNRDRILDFLLSDGNVPDPVEHPARLNATPMASIKIFLEESF